MLPRPSMAGAGKRMAMRAGRATEGRTRGGGGGVRGVAGGWPCRGRREGVDDRGGDGRVEGDGWPVTVAQLQAGATAGGRGGKRKTTLVG
jgi:hypothetical protein